MVLFIVSSTLFKLSRFHGSCIYLLLLMHFVATRSCNYSVALVCFPCLRFFPSLPCETKRESTRVRCTLCLHYKRKTGSEIGSPWCLQCSHATVTHTEIHSFLCRMLKSKLVCNCVSACIGTCATSNRVRLYGSIEKRCQALLSLLVCLLSVRLLFCFRWRMYVVEMIGGESVGLYCLSSCFADCLASTQHCNCTTCMWKKVA
jgi:hypothetical protein